MPKINTHIHLALKLVEKVTVTDQKSFLLGNAYPDCWSDSIEKALLLHYKKDNDSLCDLDMFLEKCGDDFNFGYYFHLWVDNHILQIDTGDISKYDCMICDGEVIFSVIQELKNFDYKGKEYEAMQNILQLESEPVPLYLVPHSKKVRYEQILDSIVDEFIDEYFSNI